MQFARSKQVLRPRPGGLLPFPEPAGVPAAAPPRRRIALHEVALRPRRSPSPPAAARTQTEAPARIRYAVELVGAGIMMAGFLALAILG